MRKSAILWAVVLVLGMSARAAAAVPFHAGELVARIKDTCAGKPDSVGFDELLTFGGEHASEELYPSSAVAFFAQYCSRGKYIHLRLLSSSAKQDRAVLTLDAERGPEPQAKATLFAYFRIDGREWRLEAVDRIRRHARLFLRGTAPACIP